MCAQLVELGAAVEVDAPRAAPAARDEVRGQLRFGAQLDEVRRGARERRQRVVVQADERGACAGEERVHLVAARAVDDREQGTAGEHHGAHAVGVGPG